MPKPPKTFARDSSGKRTAKIPKCPFEYIPDSDLEDSQINEITDILIKLFEKNRYPLTEKRHKFLSEHYSEPIQMLRGVHLQSYGCVKAVFQIDPELPKEYRIGLFEKPGKRYGSMIRFTNATALVNPAIDKTGKHDCRGMALKVFNVEGNVLSQDHGGHNQDFLMINQPNFALANIEEYLRLQRILDTQNDKLDVFFAPLLLRDLRLNNAKKNAILKYIEAENIEADDIPRILSIFKIVQSIQTTQVTNPLGISYFSATPFLFGPDRVMKFSARPHIEMPPTPVPQPSADNYLRNSIIESLKGNEPIIFDFLVQVRNDVSETDIEDATTIWDEKIHPFVKVATITIPSPQEVDNAETIARCEHLAFTPWHALPEHQPIGGINRLRKTIYEASAEYRLSK
ncbi:MAG: catalase family protein [Methylomicrobium sp.]